MKCLEHPKYKGIMKPRLPCERCWQIYFGISDLCINCGCACPDGEHDNGDYPVLKGS